MFDYSGYREVKRDNEGSGTCDRFSELHLRLKLILFKQPLRFLATFGKSNCINSWQDLRNCHKQWRGYTAPRAKQLGDKHGKFKRFSC
ncbi:hypothetical protein [Nostoc sp. CHAB 5715]|uniref:hypothetical protein n=1 Tax=Nostoc sp. CHAB 5715 TaxID=2780400 RepID=UPI001E3B9F67|nr:hypothetical protein [Nostoc sp. CHAB 5715]MCC5626400.1 hypothetical protein [Nostoc sp. CHAB 5715]